MSPALSAAASMAADANLAAERASQDLIAAVADRDHVDRRLNALQAERAEIMSARRNGADEPDHGARLALIAADLEVLETVRAERDAKVTAARAAADETARAHALAQQHMALIIDETTLERLVEHADKVALVLHATVVETIEISKKLRRRPAWTPSRELADVLRKLDLNRMTVAS